MGGGEGEIVGSGVDGAIDDGGGGAGADDDGVIVVEIEVEDVGGESGEFGEGLSKDVGAREASGGAEGLSGEAGKLGGVESGGVIFVGVGGGGIGEERGGSGGLVGNVVGVSGEFLVVSRRG